VDLEEYLPGIRAVAAALHNRRGLPAALWVVGLSANMTTVKIEKIAALAMKTAATLRAVLDGDASPPGRAARRSPRSLKTGGESPKALPIN
jgi:predicted transcriptional regulator